MNPLRLCLINFGNSFANKAAEGFLKPQTSLEQSSDDSLLVLASFSVGCPEISYRTCSRLFFPVGMVEKAGKVQMGEAAAA